jgi:hypothetical protein
MSAADILNPTLGSDLNPDYGYSEGLPQMNSSFQAKGGRVNSRQLMARGRVYDLAWGNRPRAIADALRQWEAQFRTDFFTYVDWERGRYFSGRFAGPLQISPSGYNKWDIRGQFVEIPGLVMFQYPNTNWFGAATQDSIFIEETDGSGNQLVKLTGTWTNEPNPPAHAGRDFFSNTLNDTAEWLYFGYGFRLWSRTQGNLGIVALSVDGGGETNIDLYSAATLNSFAISTTAVNIALGFHRVKLRVTHTKNAASTDFYCYADAIEVMQ